MFVVTDRDQQFESEIFSHLAKLFGVHRLRISVYSPQSNGFIERQHRTLKNALKAIGNSWLTDLPVVLLGLRCLKNESGLSAFEAVTGASLMLPQSLFSEGYEFSKSPLDFMCTLVKNLRTMDFAVMSEGIHHHSTTNVPEALRTCTHVWVGLIEYGKCLRHLTLVLLKF